MNITNSKFTVSDLNDFENRETRRVGTKALRTAKVMTVVFETITVIACLAYGAGICAALHYWKLIGLIVSIVVSIPIWVYVISYLDSTNKYGLSKPVENYLQHKGYECSPIMARQFRVVKSEHFTLCEIQKFLTTHPSAVLRPYRGFGSIDFEYNNGVETCEQHYQISPDSIQSFKKEDRLNCSYLDKHIERMIHF